MSGIYDIINYHLFSVVFSVRVIDHLVLLVRRWWLKYEHGTILESGSSWELNSLWNRSLCIDGGYPLFSQTSDHNSHSGWGILCSTWRKHMQHDCWASKSASRWLPCWEPSVWTADSWWSACLPTLQSLVQVKVPFLQLVLQIQLSITLVSVERQRIQGQIATPKSPLYRSQW